MAREKKMRVDSQGIPKTMRWYHFFGDGVGQLALNIISTIAGTITYFYTDKVGLAAGVVGTVLLISKVIDAIANIFMGRIVDKTRTRFGKVRHWFLWMAIPSGIGVIALFCVPQHMSANMKIAYALITNIFIVSLVYVAISIPYVCLISLRTKSTEERSVMGIVRAIFGYAVGIVLAIALIPITNALGGTQGAWIKVSVVFGIVAMASMFFTFFVSKEQNKGASVVENVDEENTTLRESIGMLLKNKNWVVMLIAMLIVNIIMALSAATGVYYAKYILHNDNLVGIMGAIGLLPVALGFAVTGPMIKKFGLARTCRIALLVGIAGTVVRCFMPTSFIATLVFGSMTTLATIPLMAVGSVLVNNTIEYNEWRFGKRLMGLNNSVSSFGANIGAGIGSAMIGWFLAIGNYNGNLKVQPQSANFMILFISIYLPLILMVILYFVMRGYTLDKQYPQIVKELAERTSLR